MVGGVEGIVLKKSDIRKEVNESNNETRQPQF